MGEEGFGMEMGDVGVGVGEGVGEEARGGGGGGGGERVGGLRILENHFWTAEAGEMSTGGGGWSEKDSELVRVWVWVCLADFDRISPPTPSPALCLYFS